MNLWGRGKRTVPNDSPNDSPNGSLELMQLLFYNLHMSEKKNDLKNMLTSVPVCLILSALTVGTIVYGQLQFTDVTGGIMIVRVIVSVVIFIIAMIAVADKRHSLFINCVFFGTLCFFLSQLWNFANFIWVEQVTTDSLIETISNVGFYMFLFSASYGALDSLADDGSKKYYKYKAVGAGAALAVAAVLIMRLMLSFSLYVLVYGIILCPVIYISVKHLVIPDIENGYIRTLRPYYFVVLLMVLLRTVETFVYGVEMLSIVGMTCRIAGIIVVIWMFPMAIKGVRKWTSL